MEKETRLKQYKDLRFIFLEEFPNKDGYSYQNWSMGDSSVVLDGTYDIEDLINEIIKYYQNLNV